MCVRGTNYSFGSFFRCQDIQERRKKALETLWQRMEDVICLLWPDTLIFPYGSYAVPGMMTPESDVDVMVSSRLFMPHMSHFPYPVSRARFKKQCHAAFETKRLSCFHTQESTLLLHSALLNSLFHFQLIKNGWWVMITLVVFWWIVRCSQEISENAGHRVRQPR